MVVVRGDGERAVGEVTRARPGNNELGARLLDVLKGAVVRRMVIGVLLFAGVRALLKGLELWT